jgi:hypothetical protein
MNSSLFCREGLTESSSVRNRLKRTQLQNEKSLKSSSSEIDARFSFTSGSGSGAGVAARFLTARLFTGFSLAGGGDVELD